MDSIYIIKQNNICLKVTPNLIIIFLNYLVWIEKKKRNCMEKGGRGGGGYR